MYNHPVIDNSDELRLEAVTVSVGFDDFLDQALTYNHPHVDTMIVVTSHSDKKTQQVCQKHGAICVQTDLMYKNGRKFNKGAAINAGFNYFQYNGWRLHLDSDIILPDNFRRMLFNNTYLDKDAIYGADRVDVIGKTELKQVRENPQHQYGMLVGSSNSKIGHRFVDSLNGYLPMGFFQLWHYSCQKPYPYSLGTAAHDDITFSSLWPKSHRHHLSETICHHLCARTPDWGENWEGNRKQPRLD